MSRSPLREGTCWWAAYIVLMPRVWRWGLARIRPYQGGDGWVSWKREISGLTSSWGPYGINSDGLGRTEDSIPASWFRGLPLTLLWCRHNRPGSLCCERCGICLLDVP
jgi:hypothetical protein